MNTLLYNVELEKKLKREMLPSNIKKAVIAAITAQFGVDIFFSFFFTNDNVLKQDIKISEVTTYYAALSSGLIIGLVSLYMDRLATIAIATLFFTITYNLVSTIKDNETNYIDSIDYINDVLASIILVYLFDPKSHIDYYNHYNERHHIKRETLDSNRSVIDIIILIIVTNSYFYIRDHINDSISPATTSSIASTPE